MRPVRLTALLGFALAAACQPAPPAGLGDADKAAIDSTSRVFVRHALANDFAALARDYYSDDAMVLPPNAPAVTGHGAIEAMFKTFPPITAFELRTEEVEGTADLAYVRGRYAMTMSPPGAPAIADSGKYLEIWRKQSDGTWKSVRDMFSSDIPLPPPPPAAPTKP
jgi:ketosteroid isomerase-like protein